MKTLIITGGMIEADFALSFIQELKPDYILGVDKGLQFCYEYDIRPDYIVGDFDSLPGEILERYRQEGEIPIRTYNPVKDATDTKIALDKALEEGSTEIWILGATGTRIDHVVCNLQILKEAWEKKVPVWIVDSRNKIGLPVEKTFSLKKEEQYGTYVSLFPMGETVEGLTLKGFKYPLDHYQLKDREGLGVSNEITADVADGCTVDDTKQRLKRQGGFLHEHTGKERSTGSGGRRNRRKRSSILGRESEDAGNISELLCKYCKNHDKIS